MTNVVRVENRELNDLAVKLYAELKAKPGRAETRSLSPSDVMYVRGVLIRLAAKDGLKISGRTDVTTRQRQMINRFNRPGPYRFWIRIEETKS